MAEVSAARIAALSILERLDRGELLDRAFASAAGAMEPRDRAWLQELLYGVVRLRGRLDHYLQAFLRRPLEDLEPRVRHLLRLGAYQLLEMGGVPAYAAISQSVDLARAAGVQRAAGFVNGVLRSLERGATSVRFPSFDESPVEHLSSWGSHPRWLVERWIMRWGAGPTRALVEANNTRPELFIRPVGQRVAAAVEALRAHGVAAEAVPGFPDSIRIGGESGPGSAMAAIDAVVQDPAAAMVVRFADLASRGTVLDLSAAPGGKSIGMADEGAFVVAADTSLRRVRRVRENAERTRLVGRVAPVVADARTPPFRRARAILLDAPCTGTGTFRRHPDGRWRVRPVDLESLVSLQRDLLVGAVSTLEVGGVLVYSTCSLEPEENEGQVDWLLARFPGLRRTPPVTPVGNDLLDGGDLRVLPQKHGVDGAYAARLERVE